MAPRTLPSLRNPHRIIFPNSVISGIGHFLPPPNFPGTRKCVITQRRRCTGAPGRLLKFLMLAPRGEGPGQERGLFPPRRRHAGLQPQRGEDLQSELWQVPSRGESGRVLLLADAPLSCAPSLAVSAGPGPAPVPGRLRGEEWYLGKLIGAGRRRPCC